MSGTGAEEIATAVDHALANGWRAEDIVGVLRGAARYANGHIIPCCTRCGRLEYEDGLILTEVIDPGARDHPPVLGGALCPPCRASDSEPVP